MTTLPPDTTPTLLGRQPILDRDGRVRGHELLFRDAASPAERATATALGALSGGLPAWIKVSREFLLTFDPFPVAPGAVVLELDPYAGVDDELIDRLVGLRAEGHVLALDDFIPVGAVAPLLGMADHVKLDLGAYGLAGVSAVLERLGAKRPHVVVYNVVSPAQRDSLLRRGADLVQGFFFELPERVEDRPVPVASVNRLQALMGLGAQPSFEEIEQIVAGDPGLTVRLLRFANSAAVGSRRRFASVREAMVLLGSERVRQFLLVVLLSDLGKGRPALVAASVMRGRLAESVARDLQLGDPDAAFTAGVLSVVDALLDQKMVDVLRSLPITEELRWAIVGHAGPVGQALDLAIRLERGRAGADAGRFTRLDDTVRWTDQALRGLMA
jgi:EAL and modified HD-GYP domain-containing signal transduction protein